jgi:aminomethyltransferase
MEHNKLQLKQTPLLNFHLADGAKMVDFAGWYLPIEYAGLRQEHEHVRNKVGIFDVSHMGEIRILGEDAGSFLDYVTCNSVLRLQNGQAQYSALLNDTGGVIDDIIVYRLTNDEYLLCVNAANINVDFEWLISCSEQFNGKVTVVDESDGFGQVALQGPLAVEVVKEIPDLVSAKVDTLKYFHFTEFFWEGVSCIAARTGYTGEDGFEFFIPKVIIGSFWQTLRSNTRVACCGLGARDTLRIEAGYPLYGHELSSVSLATESGLGWIVKMGKGQFIGREALERATNSKHKLVGFEVTGRGIARHGDIIKNELGVKCGVVTSGTITPTIGKAIGMALIDESYSSEGCSLIIEIRGKNIEARIAKLPFYSALRRSKSTTN